VLSVSSVVILLFHWLPLEEGCVFSFVACAGRQSVAHDFFCRTYRLLSGSRCVCRGKQ